MSFSSRTTSSCQSCDRARRRPGSRRRSTGWLRASGAAVVATGLARDQARCCRSTRSGREPSLNEGGKDVRRDVSLVKGRDRQGKVAK
jgi:hypothetical protein